MQYADDGMAMTDVKYVCDRFQRVCHKKTGLVATLLLMFVRYHTRKRKRPVDRRFNPLL